MRLIGTLEGRKSAQEFSYYLSKEGIENSFELSHEEGNEETYLVWVIDEDLVDEAYAEYQAFVQNPDDDKFRGHYREAKRIEEAKIEQMRRTEVADDQVGGPPFFKKKRRFGAITLLLVIASAICYLWGGLTMEQDGEYPASTIVITSPVYTWLLFDFPHAFELYNELAKQFTAKELADPKELPPKGQALIEEAATTPFWQGIYHEIMRQAESKGGGATYDGQMFEKIRQGEVWRLFTPAILHGGLFHLIFNAIWILVLGAQIEVRVGWVRYALLVILAGILANVAQYMMSGPLFMGLSGIVCAQFGFIWMRIKKAPWEGYLLQRTTVTFILVFILAMLALQVVSFMLELYGKEAVAPPIANTAHIVGALAGIVFAQFEFFSYHRAKP